jgi:predicted O-methyltransferase YrrM
VGETSDPEEVIRTELRRMFAPEEAVVADARRRASLLLPPSPEEAALLAWFAARAGATGAPDVVEVGAAGGVTALWFAPVLADGATLTSIEQDSDTHALASEAVEVGEVGEHVRAILGDPAEVLPRLTDARYGMAVLQCTPTRYASLLPDLLRVLAPGGLLVARGVLRRGGNGPLLARFLDLVRSTEELHATVLSEHDGLLLATRR